MLMVNGCLAKRPRVVLVPLAAAAAVVVLVAVVKSNGWTVPASSLMDSAVAAVAAVPVVAAVWVALRVKAVHLQ